MMPTLQGMLCCVQDKLQALTENGETDCLLPTTAKPQPGLTSSKFVLSSHVGSDSILYSSCHFCIPFDGKQLCRTEECSLSGTLRHPDSIQVGPLCQAFSSNASEFDEQQAPRSNLEKVMQQQQKKKQLKFQFPSRGRRKNKSTPTHQNPSPLPQKKNNKIKKLSR